MRIKLELNSELEEQCVSSMKRKYEENEDKFHEKKKRMTEIELGELVDFALDIVNKLKSTDEGHLSQIVRLAVDEDKVFVNIWKSLAIRKDENARIQKFVSLMNVLFDMVSISDVSRMLGIIYDFTTDFIILYSTEFKDQE